MPDAGRVAPISGSVWCLRLMLTFDAYVSSHSNILPVIFPYIPCGVSITWHKRYTSASKVSRSLARAFMPDL